MEAGEKTQIKKGLNIYWYYWTIPVFIAFVLINYYSQNVKIETLNMGVMISVVSFLFGFLVTICFSMLLNDFFRLKECFAMETARISSLFLLSEQLGEKFHKATSERIDAYTMKTLGQYSSYDIGRNEIYGIYRDLKFMDIKTDYQKQLSASFLRSLDVLQSVREQLEYLTSRKVDLPLKISTYILGSLLIILLFLQRGDTFTNALFIILSTTIVFIFLIIEDYDGLKMGNYSYNISNSEQLFDLIGKERYYPSHLLGSVELERGRKYRIGFYNANAKEEKIFIMTYDPKFIVNLKKIAFKFKIK